MQTGERRGPRLRGNHPLRHCKEPRSQPAEEERGHPKPDPAIRRIEPALRSRLELREPEADNRKDHAAKKSGTRRFGRFSIADCMYYPMRTRFRTYGVSIPDELEPYAKALDCHPAVRKLERVGRGSPRIAAYDEYLRSVGGDPDAA